MDTDGAATLWDGLDLAELLTLESLSDDCYQSRHGESNFGGEIFGGQYLGLAIAAALATGEGRAPQVMHGHFLRGARASSPLDAQVERLREGRSFSHRRVLLKQDDAIAFCADIGLHDAEPAEPDHQRPVPLVPPPEALPDMSAWVATAPDEQMVPSWRQRVLSKAAVELRPVNPHAGFTVRGVEPKTSLWLRAVNPPRADAPQHYAILAYLSDYCVNFPARIMHGRSLFAGELTSASLNHSIWFHRRPDVSDWLLYVLDSPSAHGGTGFNRGLIYSRDGTLLASTAQEALLRRIKPVVRESDATSDDSEMRRSRRSNTLVTRRPG